MIKLIWFGQLGNHIIQLINILHLVLYYKYRVKLPKHAYFDTKYIEKQFDNHNSNNNRVLEGIFFHRQRIKNITQEAFDVNHDRVINILRRAFIIKDIDSLDKDDVVLHIRGGNIFSRNPHPKYIQPPLSYYVNILDNNNFNRVIIVAEDAKNPVLNELLKIYPSIIYKKRTWLNIIYKKQKLKQDIEIIMGASKIINSFGTFIPYLSLLSNNIKQLYQTSYQSIDVDRAVNIEYAKYSHFNIHNTDLTDYRLKLTPWENTKEQRDILLNYKV